MRNVLEISLKINAEFSKLLIKTGWYSLPKFSQMDKN